MHLFDLHLLGSTHSLKEKPAPLAINSSLDSQNLSKSKTGLTIDTGLMTPSEPVAIPYNNNRNPAIVDPLTPPLTATSPECTDDDYELLDHLQNDEDFIESIATIQSTFLWDGICRGRFLSFPHLALHGSAHTSQIMRVLESWLCDKLMQPQLGDLLPILEESIPDSCRSIMDMMHKGKAPLSILL